jgi:hypothetical protein
MPMAEMLFYRQTGLDLHANEITYKITEVTMMPLQVTQEELALLKMYLTKAESTTLIEINHARRVPGYQDYLKLRHKEINVLLGKIQKLLPDEQ